MTAESGSESAAEELLRTSMRKSRDVHNLLQFRLNSQDTSMDDSGMRNSIIRRSARHFYEEDDITETKNRWDDDTPMLSSINEPLSQHSGQERGNVRVSNSSSQRSRYDEEPSPSYISSINSKDISQFTSKGSYGSSNVKSSFPDSAFSDRSINQRDRTFGTDSYSSFGRAFDNSLTLTSTLPDGLDLNATIDSEGDMLLKDKESILNEKEINRRADEYEREAAVVSFMDTNDLSNNTSELRKSDGNSVESPFKDFKGRNRNEDDDNGSDQSFALSDSHNMD